MPPVAAPAPAALQPPDATPVAAPPAATEARCTNCGAEAGENYCPRCGQETHDLHRSLAGILGELLDAFAGWDGKIPTTLWLLVRRPGALTREFLSGRRARYLRPLRLYLTMSVAFFLSLSLLPGKQGVVPREARDQLSGVQIDFSETHEVKRLGPAAPAARRARSDSAYEAFLARNIRRTGNDPANWTFRHLAGGMKRLKDLPARERARVMGAAVLAKAPNMVFLLLPVFALLTRLMYLRRPVFYAEHFVFALHNHAFAYLGLTLAHVASAALRGAEFNPLKIVLLGWLPVYFFVSMRRVFGGSRRATLLRFAALSLVYGTILGVATFVTALVAIVEMA